MPKVGSPLRVDAQVRRQLESSAHKEMRNLTDFTRVLLLLALEAYEKAGSLDRLRSEIRAIAQGSSARRVEELETQVAFDSSLGKERRKLPAKPSKRMDD